MAEALGDWLAAMAPAWHELAASTPARLEAALAAYRERARALAVDAVRRAGLACWPEPVEAPRFEALFDGLAPNGLQQAAIELAPQLSGPGVVLIEAPSGAGKTEAALYLAAHTVHARQAHGLLVAVADDWRARRGSIGELAIWREGEPRR
jgi:CRISPR-associated endonuclease/helicase Cas3